MYALRQEACTLLSANWNQATVSVCDLCDTEKWPEVYYTDCACENTYHIKLTIDKT